MAYHIAIKCTYCDGGKGKYSGFNDICSNDNIMLNVRGRTWCSHEDNKCRQYFERNFKGGKPKVTSQCWPCYESVLFRDWEFGAGEIIKGKRAGEPVHYHDIGKSKIAFLTTRFPGDREENRKIVGLFAIEDATHTPFRPTLVTSQPWFRIKLSTNISKSINFWQYFGNGKKPQWGERLIHYLRDDKQVLEALRAIAERVNEKDKFTINKYIEKVFTIQYDYYDSARRIQNRNKTELL
jgi:hypothetical protein